MKIFLFMVLVSFPVFAQGKASFPEIPSKGKVPESFIPVGWKQLVQATGDLNSDHNEDVVIVIEETDPKKVVKNKEALGPELLNLNRRGLIILFMNKDNKGYVNQGLKFGFIPSANDAFAPCLADPLLDGGGIVATNGIIEIKLQYFVSCGSYGVETKTFKLRYQKNVFSLIGYDFYEMSRSMGDESKKSINYITGSRSITTGGNVFFNEENKPKTIWEAVSISKPISLDTLELSDF